MQVRKRLITEYKISKKMLEIIYKKTGDLIPYINNARTHSPEQVLQIAASIKEFGFSNPILIDGKSGIIAGHGRVLAALKLGMETLPVIELSHLSDRQRKAYILADNRLAEKSGWDDDLLRLELGELKDLDFDLSLIGFDDFYLTIDDIDSGEPKIDGGIEYQEKFSVLIDCSDEANQEETYEKMVGLGYSCKILVN
jgi:hypothetical protein